MSRPPSTTRTPSIFISYRRADTEGHAGRLSDNLKQHFGDRAHIFMDFDAIPAGEDFVKVINEAVGSCHALIALIGRQWLTQTDAKTGRRRLDNDKDQVRAEIATALKRGVRVVPVLVQGATMPAEEELPDDLKPLASRHALEVSGARWSYDVQTLIRALEQTLPAGARPGSGLRKWVAARPRHKAGVIVVTALILLALSVPAALWVRTRFDAPTPTPTANVNANGDATNANTAAMPAPGGTNTNAAAANNNGNAANTSVNTNADIGANKNGAEAGAADVASLSAVISNFGPAVVRITIATEDGSRFFGSGFILTRAGHILTAEHVVRPPAGAGPATQYSVRLPGGSERAASLLDADERLGLGILKTEPGDYKTITLAAGEPETETRVIALGAAFEGGVDPKSGTIREKSALFYGIAYYLPGAPGGLAGGPILNARGEAVGIFHSERPPLVQCVRSDIARRYLQSQGVTP
jgi:hypothetical protein